MNATIEDLRHEPPDVFSFDELAAMSARIVAADSFGESRDEVVGPTRQWRRPLVLSGASAAVAGAAAAAILLGVQTSPPSRIGGHSTHPPATIRAKLLAALDGASDDVVETRTVIADGQVIDRFANGDNTRSLTYISASGMEPAEESLVVYGGSGTTITDVFPATKTYVVEPPGSSTAGEPIAPPSIRNQVEDGVLAIVATGETIDGHDTIELTATGAGPSAGVDHLWVDASTYLPVRETTAPPSGVSGGSAQSDWSYYPPGSGALAKLLLQIPSDYTQISTPPTTIAPTTSAP